ncbi:MAG: plasmid recombination protein, partial [Clostridia bacterium]|nr:plasmid recombination protein [Clostridia bacterium]
MARNDGVDRIVARNNNLTAKQIGNTEKHNERKKESYVNPDIVSERSYLNYHYKSPSGEYESVFASMVESGEISTRGLKPDAKKYGEMIIDVNSAYFHNHGGYEYAKRFYASAYRAAAKIIGGEKYILSAVMHADERNSKMSKELGKDIYHYHLHIVYITVVEKEIRYSKRCKEQSIVG